MESGQDEHHGTGDAVIDNLRGIIAGLEYHEGRQRARAEAAERQLASAQQRIAALERLVPDEVILECAAFIMRTGYVGAENCPAKLEEYAAAIREYREEGK